MTKPVQRLHILIVSTRIVMVQRQHMVTINYNAKSEGYAETCDAYGQSYGEDNKCKRTAIYNRYTHYNY